MTGIGSAGGAGNGGNGNSSGTSEANSTDTTHSENSSTGGLGESLASSSATSSHTSTEALAAEPTTSESLAASPTTADTLSGKSCAVPEQHADENTIDDFHSCTSGVDNKAAIDAAQARTAAGGCAALSASAMLCNPAGPEIGEYTVGRPAGFPDSIGPGAPYAHEYTSRASTPGSWPSLLEHTRQRLQENPTPGTDSPATAAGVINDAGVTPFPGSDLVRSSISTDVQGRQVISNVTIPGDHWLDPGIVSQTAWQDNRRTYAVAVGEGNGLLSIPANPVAEQVFEQKLESDFRVAISRDTQR